MADAATNNYRAPEGLGTYATRALFVGASALVLALVVSLLTGGVVQFFRAYLVGFFFVCGLTVGSLAWLMLGHLTGGAWGLVTRRAFEAATRTLPVVAVLFLPVVVALFVHDHGHALYEWTNHELVAKDEALRHKSKYLNEWFFIVRAVFYFAIWGLFTYLMNKWSAQQDTTGDPRVRRLMQDVSAPGILLFGLTSTFAAIDWGMSLEPHWFSTIYGLIAMAGWGLSALAFIITVVVMLSERDEYRDVYQPSHLHDLGKLLLAMVMLFAYFAFSQFLIIWAGNLPEETTFYLRRLRGGWQFVGLALILFHFALPFVLLLSRGRKRRGAGLRRIAILMLLMRVVDLIFMFAPASQQGGHEGAATAGIPLRDFLTMGLATAGVGGVWLWFFLRELRRRPLLPLNSPDLEKALAVSAHH
jgi:hypothetical protein